MQGEFVERNRGLSREEKDSRLFNMFWEDAAKLFNSTNKDLLEFPGSETEVFRFENLGLRTAPTGYVATADILEDKFNEMRSDYMAINVKFMTSGNGDGPITLEESLTVCSSKFKDFCRGQPVIEFFYFALISFNILASAAQYMPPAASSSSSSPGSTMSRLGGDKGSSAVRMKQQAAATAEAVAKVLPKTSPATKALEKRVLEGNAALTESRVKIAKTEELFALKKQLAAKELEVAAKGTSTCLRDNRLLAHMRSTVRKMEDESWGFKETLADEADAGDSDAE